jgi:hypothetical protein
MITTTYIEMRNYFFMITKTQCSTAMSLIVEEYLKMIICHWQGRRRGMTRGNKCIKRMKEREKCHN